MVATVAEAAGKKTASTSPPLPLDKQLDKGDEEESESDIDWT